MATPAMAQELGSRVCKPEAGDNRVTRWTEIRAGSLQTQLSRGIMGTAAPTHNSVFLRVNLNKSELDESGYSTPLPTDPKQIGIAVMGNDAKAGTRVWGRIVGIVPESGDDLTGDFTFGGLEPNAHYVAVLYSPYSVGGNLDPFFRLCFRTARDPANPYGGEGSSGCFAPYTPTVGGERQPAPRSQSAYQACVQARNACNAASNTTWETAGNRCIPASN